MGSEIENDVLDALKQFQQQALAAEKLAKEISGMYSQIAALRMAKDMYFNKDASYEEAKHFLEINGYEDITSEKQLNVAFNNIDNLEKETADLIKQMKKENKDMFADVSPDLAKNFKDQLDKAGAKVTEGVHKLSDPVISKSLNKVNEAIDSFKIAGNNYKKMCAEINNIWQKTRLAAENAKLQFHYAQRSFHLALQDKTLGTTDLNRLSSARDEKMKDLQQRIIDRQKIINNNNEKILEATLAQNDILAKYGLTVDDKQAKLEDKYFQEEIDAKQEELNKKLEDLGIESQVFEINKDGDFEPVNRVDVGKLNSNQYKALSAALDVCNKDQAQSILDSDMTTDKIKSATQLYNSGCSIEDVTKNILSKDITPEMANKLTEATNNELQKQRDAITANSAKIDSISNYFKNADAAVVAQAGMNDFVNKSIKEMIKEPFVDIDTNKAVSQVHFEIKSELSEQNLEDLQNLGLTSMTVDPVSFVTSNMELAKELNDYLTENHIESTIEATTTISLDTIFKEDAKKDVKDTKETRFDDFER